jgi:hypothetical protein
MIICRLYKLTLSDQAQVTLHSPTDSQSFRFSVKVFSRSALAGGSEKIFSPGHESALGGFGGDVEGCHAVSCEHI